MLLCYTYADQITDNLAKICQVCTQLNLLILYSDAPSEPYQTSKKKRFAKIFNT